MADLSATHTMIGGTWIPKAWTEATPTAAPSPDASFDDFDIARYAAAIRARFEAAARTCDIPTLTSDQRQYATGHKAGLAEALRLLDAGRRQPMATPAEPAAASTEEPHS